MLAQRFSMDLSREFFDPALIFIATLGLIASTFLVATVRAPYRVALRADSWMTIVAALLVSAGTAFLCTGGVLGTLFALGISLALIVAVRSGLPRLSAAGALSLALSLITPLLLAPWGYLLLAELGFPGWALNAFLAGTCFSLALMGVSFASKLARTSLITHRRWDRPIAPLALARGRDVPMVSVHVPCYAEPPGVVIATLDRLAALSYPRFEVIVCDNNTADENLWHPVMEHCHSLNAKLGRQIFRFFHVAPLGGAKAGALNFCATHTDPEAQLIAVLDADYQSSSDFLGRLIGFFEKPQIAFVQTSHDYRDLGEGAYRRMCYSEYIAVQKVDYASLQEYDAAVTIGTMCIVRRVALQEAGGCAEWCLTEDSELSVRLRAKGYEGIFLRETFGRGLIPETFDDYKKQRFRWTAGPIQQLRRHWRLYLPRPFAGSSHIPGWVKLIDLEQGVLRVLAAIGAPIAFIGSAFVGMMMVKEALPDLYLPAAAWISIGVGVATGLISTWHRFRLAGVTHIHQMIGGFIATQSLTYTQMIAAFAGLSGRPLAWRRTPKFRARGSLARGLRSALPETVLGSLLLATAFFPLAWADEIGAHMMLIGAFGAAAAALPFLCAPVMAFMNEWDLAKERREKQAASSPVPCPQPANS